MAYRLTGVHCYGCTPMRPVCYLLDVKNKCWSEADAGNLRRQQKNRWPELL